MNVHEAYMSEIQGEQHSETVGERDMLKEQMLQLSWLQYYFESLHPEEEWDDLLQKIAEQSSEQAGRIARATGEEKLGILIDNMIDSALGKAETSWFRLHFPNDRSKPLAPEYKKLFDAFESDPAAVNRELSERFKKDTPTH